MSRENLPKSKPELKARIEESKEEGEQKKIEGELLHKQDKDSN